MQETILSRVGQSCATISRYFFLDPTEAKSVIFPWNIVYIWTIQILNHLKKQKSEFQI